MDLICTKYKSYKSGSLQGYFDITFVDTGLQIFGCSLFMKNGKRWVSFPSKEYINSSGETKYQPYVKYNTLDIQSIFQNAALKAIDQFCKEQENAKNDFEEECPF
jgi:hypothetical protein